jgi:hypothetical protein
LRASSANVIIEPALMRESPPARAWMLPVGCTALAALAAPAALAAADDTPSRWTFAPVPHLYLYQVVQTTEFASAGDHLRYVAALSWKVAALASAADIHPELVRVGATILNVTATLDGPHTHHAIDTAQPTPEAVADPVFGHLFALVGRPRFVIDCDPRTGAVSAVSGGDEVAAGIAQQAPSPFGGDEPSPLAAPAQAAYGTQTLAELWSQLLALPGPGVQQVPLAAPLSGALARRWNGLHWTLALPEGTTHLPVVLGSGPLAITGTLSDLSGEGAIAPKAGMPSAAQGTLSFTLTLAALTQPVVEQQHITWSLADQAP